MQDPGHALQTHAGVDVLAGQGCQNAVGIPVGLHKHQVVKLYEALVILQIDDLVTLLRLQVVVQFGAGTARTCGASTPKVVGCTHGHNPVGFYPHRLCPDGGGFLILTEHTHHQAPRVQAKHLCAEFPSPANGLLLKVVPKRKVAQHLEERVMPCRATHILNVIGANALLGTGGPMGRPRFLPEKHRLEGKHPRNGEQDGGVVRHQGSTRQQAVATGCIKVQEGEADGRAATGLLLCRHHDGWGCRRLHGGEA